MIPEPFRSEADRLPRPLRELLEAELAAGNSIVEVASHFPAPPAGVYFMLARPVSTRPRAPSAGVAFYHRNSSQYAGEFHDGERFFFILEAPLPPEPLPDMDAIREALEAQERASRRRLGLPEHADASRSAESSSPDLERVTPATAARSNFDRFVDSMAIDYDKWREGIGYDLDALAAATPNERATIEQMLVPHATRGWRDVEALAALATDRAHDALRTALRDGGAEVRAAVVRHAPELVDEEARTDSLVRGLREASFFGGLSEMLDDAAEFHPPAVVDVLFREALQGPGDKAVHCAALLFHVHGLTEESFDWEHRPFFLRFNTDDRAARDAAFVELCQRVGVDPARYR